MSKKTRTGSGWTLQELSGLVGGTVVGDNSERIFDIAVIDRAGEGDITWLASPKYKKHLSGTRASAVILDAPKKGCEHKNLLIAKNPQLALIKVLELLRPAPRPEPGVHPSAEVHEDATLGADVSIGANAVIERGVVIGDCVVIHPGVFIGTGADIGARTIVYSNVSIREGVIIGQRVIVNCNSVIGADGFGYAEIEGKYLKIPQRGIVRIKDDCEIGACVTIDRATVGETVVGRGTKIDNLVMIAHNVQIGEDAIIVAQVGISGSTRIGDRVQLAGQVGLVGHLEIGFEARVGAKAGVAHDIPPKEAYSGSPAIPHMKWLRSSAVVPKLPEMKKTLDKLDKRVELIEERLDGKEKDSKEK